MARLDRLGPARKVAQIGSVIGRGFSYKLLRDCAEIGDATLERRSKSSPKRTSFWSRAAARKQLPLQARAHPGAAYENLLKSRRQVLHRRVGETLRDRFTESAC